ncbi:MAG: hypothetical protein N2746_06500 [Deltaproteobacteria bacterium]|nr:hypothetical protein [Deltaproteobacteria bacterium]
MSPKIATISHRDNVIMDDALRRFIRFVKDCLSSLFNIRWRSNLIKIATKSADPKKIYLNIGSWKVC